MLNANRRRCGLAVRMMAIGGLAMLVLAAVVTPARGDEHCDPSWSRQFGPTGGSQPGGPFNASTGVAFDDGSGPRMYVGGGYLQINGTYLGHMRRWDGVGWDPFAFTMNGRINALAVYDDGGGPALYAGGGFTQIDGVAIGGVARWTGTGWSPVGGGTNGEVLTLRVLDTGSGPKLYAGGFFTTAGGVAAGHVARLDGGQWTPMNGGITVGVDTSVRALEVFDAGSGPQVYAAGSFQVEGAATMDNVARWNGAAWEPIADGLFLGTPWSLHTFDDGSGPALYIGGFLFMTDSDGQVANNIFRWDGSRWTRLATGVNNICYAMATFEGALHAGGTFTMADGQTVNRVARWDGQSWSPLEGPAGVGFSSGFGVRGFAIHDDGERAGLFAFGGAGSAGGLNADGTARWDGTVWDALGDGFNGRTIALASFDDGSGPALYAHGSVTLAGGRAVNRVAKFDGRVWTPLGAGVNATAVGGAMLSFDDGSGPALFVGSGFTTAGGEPAMRIAKWDGMQWHTLGSGVGGAVFTMLGVDDGSGPALFVGGSFATAGGISAPRIAKWTSAGWAPVGGGVGISSNSVRDMVVHNDGSGTALFVAGDFTVAGGVGAGRIARWNGSVWSPLIDASNVNGVAGVIRALAVFDDGSGPALYAGGFFQQAGSTLASRIARWDGLNWSPLGSGVNDFVNKMVVFDDGSGPSLFVGGNFTLAGGVASPRIARWDGDSWHPVGGGLNDQVESMLVYGSGEDARLFVGGNFTTAGTVPSHFIGEWLACRDGDECAPDLNGDGLVDFFDVSAFLNAYSAGDGSADYNADGLIDFFDVLAFLNGYSAGCD